MMNMDAVAVVSILSAVFSLVILVVMVVKGIALIKADPPEDK